MNGMNYVIMSNMSTCMNALCRHVTKNKSQGGLKGGLKGGLRRGGFEGGA